MEPTAQSLSRTYSDSVHDDPWETVLVYRRVKEFAADHPNMGSSAVSTRLDLTRSRIRPWMNGSIPDPERGIQTAIDHGWLNPDPDSEMAHHLTILLAHVLGGGRIRSDSPQVAVTPGKRVSVSDVQDAFANVGLDTDVRNESGEGQAPEIVATKDGVVLGRCLIATGAPRGSKTDLDSLPAVLNEVPEKTRREFARVYVRHRALEYEDKDTLQINTERPATFFTELASFLEDITGESVTASDGGVTISATAARALTIDS